MQAASETKVCPLSRMPRASQVYRFSSMPCQPPCQPHAFEQLRQGEGLETALAAGYGVGLGVLEREWRAKVGRHTTVTSILLAVGVPATGLLAFAAVRALRRRRARRTLEQLKDKKAKATRGPDGQRVHIVFSGRDDRVEPPVIPEAEIPKVEHEGEWHTLH